MYEQKKSKFDKTYLVFAMALFFLVGATEHAQFEALQHFVGFNGTGFRSGNPVYELLAAFPKLDHYYGLLAGFGFYATNATFGMILGQAADRINRKNLLATMLLLCGAVTIMQSQTHSFLLFCLARLVQGLTCAAFSPAVLSMMSDTFPKQWMGKVNGIFSAGGYIGAGASSLLIMTIMRFGWRISMAQLGAAVSILGLLSFILLKEPERSMPVENQEKISLMAGFRKLWNSDRTTKLLALGNAFHYMKPCFFLPIFFLKKFSAYSAQYSLIHAFSGMVCAPLSQLISGYLSDKYRTNSSAKPTIMLVGNLIGLPLMIAAFLAGNFWLAMALICLEQLIGEMWWTPSLTMMQERVGSRNFGTIFSAATFFTGLTESIALGTTSYLLTRAGGFDNTGALTAIICSFATLAYVGSSVSFLLAGFYQKQRPVSEI